jgi:hypothetical protein
LLEAGVGVGADRGEHGDLFASKATDGSHRAPASPASAGAEKRAELVESVLMPRYGSPDPAAWPLLPRAIDRVADDDGLRALDS